MKWGENKISKAEVALKHTASHLGVIVVAPFVAK